MRLACLYRAGRMSNGDFSSTLARRLNAGEENRFPGLSRLLGASSGGFYLRQAQHDKF
jgi:hypothetical protein